MTNGQPCRQSLRSALASTRRRRPSCRRRTVGRARQRGASDAVCEPVAFVPGECSGTRPGWVRRRGVAEGSCRGKAGALERPSGRVSARRSTMRNGQETRAVAQGRRPDLRLCGDLDVEGVCPMWAGPPPDLTTAEHGRRLQPPSVLSTSSSDFTWACRRSAIVRFLCACSRRRSTPRSVEELTTVSIRSARPSLRYCLIRECL